MIIRKPNPRKITFDLIFDTNPEKGFDAVCRNFPLTVHINKDETVAKLTQPVLEYFAKKRLNYECKAWYLDNKRKITYCILK